MALWESKIWSNAVLEEAKEILELHEKQSELLEIIRDNPGTINKQVHELRNRARAKEYFLIMALNKAKDWIEFGIDYNSKFDDHLKYIDNQLPYIRDIRNMREHEIKYYQGGGHKQKDFIIKNGHSMSDATSTRVDERGYTIGGRINVQHTIEVFKSILPFIEEAYDNFSVL